MENALNKVCSTELSVFFVLFLNPHFKFVHLVIGACARNVYNYNAGASAGDRTEQNKGKKQYMPVIDFICFKSD